MGAEESKPVPVSVGGTPDESASAAAAAAAQQTHAKEIPSALVIVGPSGVGKGTLIRRLLENNNKYGFAVSHTTRQPRDGEKVRGGKVLL